MSLPGLIIAIILFLSVLLVSILPIFARSTVIIATALNRQRDRALTYYERILTNIRDLDEDLATGKIADDEHRIEREIWMQRGVQLLKMLDYLNEQNLLTQTAAADDAEIDAAIEDAIRAASTHQQAEENTA